jgi:hypothetical protein
MAVKFTYTETEVQEIVQKYQAGVALDVIATDYSKSVPSVRMKLVKLGVYQKVTPTTKTKTTGSVAEPKAGFPTSKSGILAYYKSCVSAVGYSEF